MKIRLWKTLCFVFVIVGMTVAVFPDKKRLVALYLDSKMLQKAQSELDILLAATPDDKRLRLLADKIFKYKRDIVDTDIDNGDFQKARFDVDELLKQKPDDTILRAITARLLYFENKRIQAVELLESALEEHETNDEGALVRIAEIGEEISELNTAIASCERLVGSAPDECGYKSWLASLYLQANKPQDAYWLYKNLVESDLDSAEFVTRLLTTAGFTGNPLAMAESADLVGERFPGNHLFFRNRVDLYLACNLPLKAYPLLKELAILEKRDSDLLTLVKVADFTGDLAISIEAADLGLKLRPDNPHFIRKRAEIHLAASEPRKSYRLYKKLAESGSHDRETLEQMILAAGNSEDMALQTDAAELVGRLLPDDPRLMYKRAELYLASGETARAIPILETLFAEYPSDPSPLFVIAKIHEWDRDRERAVAAWERAAAAINKTGKEFQLRFPDSIGIDWIYTDIPKTETAVWKRLASYHHYSGNNQKEAMAVMALLSLESATEFPDDIMIRLLNRELNDLLENGDEAMPNDPYMGGLLTGLYRIRNEHMEQIRQSGHARDDRDYCIRKCFGLFVNADRISRGQNFAWQLDRALKSEARRRLEFVNLLRWSRMDRKAVLALSEMAEADPHNQKLLSLLAETGLKTGEMATVLRASTALIASADDNSACLDNLLLGAGGTEKTLEIVKRLQIHRPHDLRLVRKEAKLWLAMNRPDKAYPPVRNLALRTQEKADVLQMLTVAGHTGQQEIIRDSLTRVLNIGVKDTKVLETAAEMCLWINRPDQAAMLMGIISDEDPDNPIKAKAAGDAFSKAGDLEKCVRYLERALAQKPEDSSLRMELVKYYGWTNRRQKLIEALISLKNLGLLMEDQRIVLARFYLDRKDGVNALGLLEDLEHGQRLPQNGGIMLASAFELADRPGDAIRIYVRLARENAEQPNFLADLGNRARWLNHNDVALDFYEKSLKLDPKHLIALKGSGLIYASDNKPELAIRQFETYIRLNPNDYEINYQLGELYFANRREDEALEKYQKTLKIIEKAKRRER